MRTLRSALVGVLAISLASAAIPAIASAAPSLSAAAAVVDDIGTLYPMAPARILDTRIGLGGPSAPIGPNSVRELQVINTAGIPADASTVVLNVTVTGATSGSFLTVYPADAARPTASSINFGVGFTGANSVTVKVGDNGKVAFYNAGGSVHVIADVSGYYTKGHGAGSTVTGGQYFPLGEPGRLVDTRDWGIGKIPADNYILAVSGFTSNGIDVSSHVRALAVNITVTQPSGSGFLTAWDGSGFRPGTSTLNYSANQTIPNFAVVPIAPCDVCDGDAQGLPSIGVYTTTDAHIIVDIVGFYDDGTVVDGLRFQPNVPVRIVDSRIGQGLPSSLGPAQAGTVTTPGPVVTDDTWALAANVTAVLPTQPTFLAVYPPSSTVPEVSNLNPVANTVVANAVQTLIDSDFRFNVYNAGGNCHVVVDVVGTFYLPAPAAAARSLGAKRAVGTYATTPMSTRIVKRG